MNSIYRFVALDARKGTDQLTPDEWAKTLGIEVTAAALADACGLGNIDPQHGHSRGAEWLRRDAHALAAIGVARDAVEVPEHGTILATVRPDVDALGAMAVFVLRYLADHEATGWSPEAWARIALIAERDGFAPGAAWAPRPLPTLAQPWPTTAAPVEETQSLASLGVICSPAPGQQQHPMSLRVAVLACWIIGIGETFEHVDEVDRIFEACGVPHDAQYDGRPGMRRWGMPGYYLEIATRIAEAARSQLATDIASGATKIRVTLGHAPTGGMYYEEDHDGLLSMNDYENNFSYVGEQARVAVVDYGTRGALGVGYCVAPVVVATGLPVEGGGRKFTVAAWSAKLVDFPALVAELNQEERLAREAMGLAPPPRAEMVDMWGGNLASGILGSPQGAGSVLPLKQIVAIVLRHIVGGGDADSAERR